MNLIRCIAALFTASLLWILPGCQGNNSSFSNPRPRSREAAGDVENLPPEAKVSERIAIDTDGGEIEYRQCRLTVPRGAVPEVLFIEIQIPSEPQSDVFWDSAYQINPDGFEFNRDALLTIAYFDDDIPPGKEETDVVIVYNVNGVWVELSNCQVRPHHNLVEAPVRFTGLYALRMASEDPRRLNTPPVAVFESAAEPYPEMLGISIDEANEATGPPEEGEVSGKEGNTEEGVQGAAGEPGTPIPAGKKFDLNSASSDELEDVPGLTTDMAEQIVRYRDSIGPFTSTRDLLNKLGFDEEVYDQASPYLTVDSRLSSSISHPGAESDWIIERRVVGGPEEERDAYQSGTTATAAETDFAESLGLADWPEFTSAVSEVTVYFSAVDSYDPDGKVVQYDWDFDSDGVFDHTSHSSPYAKHTFKHNGDYSVVLKVTDNGRYAQAGYTTRLVKIRNPQAMPEEMSAVIGAFPPSGIAPHTINFASTVTGGTAPYSYRWNFSDGSESVLANPYTTYPEPGGHSIGFEVIDHAGQLLSGSLYVAALSDDGPATPLPRMQLTLSPSGDRGQAPHKVAFRVETERATRPVTYRVTFGDEAAGDEELTTTTNTFDHVFNNSGFYMVKVIATDADLRTASTFATVHALPSASPRDFTASDRMSGSDPFSFGHDVRIAYDYSEDSSRSVTLRPVSDSRDTGAMNYQWEFGDGNFSTVSKPEHTYATDGVYEIRLTADDGLQRFRHRIWLPVSSTSPAVAIQRPAYVEGPAPLGLTFDAIVTRGEEPLRYDWEFGLARRSDPGTYYAFQLAGDYTANLTVYDKWDQPIYAPEIQVKVRPVASNYRQPLAVVQPVAGSTRAVVLDYTAANPLPLSSPHVEGPVSAVKLSADGRNIGILGEDGLLVKRVNSAQPVLSFLPSGGTLVDYEVGNGDVAFCSVETFAGNFTYLLRPGFEPLQIGEGTIAAVSATGSRVVLATAGKANSPKHSMLSVSVSEGTVRERQDISEAREVRLSGDGRTVYLIDSGWRLARFTVGDGEREYLSGGEDRKSGLVVSEDGSAVAFVSNRGGDQDIIYGRNDPDGMFRLASVTDQCGVYSEQLGLSADGYYLQVYGSRDELADLVAAAADAAMINTLAAGDLSGIEGEDMVDDGELMPEPPRRRERFGVIRLDLSGSPDEWSIRTVNPRFISESTARFDVAGPF